jgi:hypothetical protein
LHISHFNRAKKCEILTSVIYFCCSSIPALPSPTVTPSKPKIQVVLLSRKGWYSIRVILLVQFVTLIHINFRLPSLLLSILAKKKEAKKVAFSQRRTCSVSKAATTLNRSLQYRIPFGIVFYDYSALTVM